MQSCSNKQELTKNIIVGMKGYDLLAFMSLVKSRFASIKIIWLHNFLE